MILSDRCHRYNLYKNWMGATGRHPSLASGIDAGRTRHLPSRLHRVKERNEAIFSDWSQSALFEIGRFAPSLVLWLINLHHTDWFNRLTRTEIHTVSWSQLEQLWAAKIGQEWKNPMSPPHWTSQITTVKPVFRMLSLGWISPSLHDRPTDGRQCYSSRILGMTEFGHAFCDHSLNHETKIGITETMNG